MHEKKFSRKYHIYGIATIKEPLYLCQKITYTQLKKTIIILLLLDWMMSCVPDESKQTQSIDFAEIAPQLLQDRSLQLQATASSGLPVLFSSWNTEIAVIEGDKTVFKQTGQVNIIAYQPGNEQFYEAPEITRQLLIRDWDPTKKIQTVDFELPAEWKLSRNGQLLKLNTVASSGLSISYVLSTEKYGRLLNANTVYFYHAGEGGLRGEDALSYVANVSIIASQAGNEEYNPADNVKKTVRVIGDVVH
jgi:hypothetical protein